MKVLDIFVRINLYCTSNYQTVINSKLEILEHKQPEIRIIKNYTLVSHIFGHLLRKELFDYVDFSRTALCFSIKCILDGRN